MDWAALEEAAFRAAGPGGMIDGLSLARLRARVLDDMAWGAEHIAAESGMSVEPISELLVVDRRSWVAGNVRTLRDVFVDLPAATDARVVAWEGGLILGIVSRAVIAQYDPYRDALIVVYPNLGEATAGSALRWIVLHELTHLAQFRTAPWLRDMIVELGTRALSIDQDAVREASRRMMSSLPELLGKLRAALAGKGEAMPVLLELLPDEQRGLVMQLHAALTLLEGHATHVTDVVGRKLIPNYDAMQESFRRSRRKPALMRVAENAIGLDMKRQQYVQGRGFCDEVWKRGGAAALAPAFERRENLPTPEEIRDPDAWLARVGA